MELLARKQERLAAGQPVVPRTDAVLIVNGGLFADAHSHPWHATPLIKSFLGGPAMWAAQRSEPIFGQVIGSANLFSKDYGVTRDEIHELYSAITRGAGAAFLHRAGYVAEHQANADRWDLRRVYLPHETRPPSCREKPPAKNRLRVRDIKQGIGCDLGAPRLPGRS